MNAEKKDHPDPLIDEVRERRRQIWEECDHDFDKLLERIQGLQAEHPGPIVDRRKAKRSRATG
jgi:hypothetical protein